MPTKTPTPPPAPAAPKGRAPESPAIATQRSIVDRLATQYDAMMRDPKRNPKAYDELGAQLFTARDKLNKLLAAAKK